MDKLDKPGMCAQHLRQALMLYQVCDPDNSAQLAQIKHSIAAADAAQQALVAGGVA